MTPLEGYEAPIAILVVFSAVLMSFSKGLPNFGNVSVNWVVLLMIIMYILLIMIAIEIVRITLEQCVRKNSLLKNVIKLVFILILDFLSGLILGVFYKLRSSEIISSLISLMLKDNDNIIGDKANKVIEKLLFKEIDKIENIQDYVPTDQSEPVIYDNIIIWRRDNNNE